MFEHGQSCLLNSQPFFFINRQAFPFIAVEWLAHHGKEAVVCVMVLVVRKQLAKSNALATGLNHLLN